METENLSEEDEFSNISEEILSILETKKTLIYAMHTLLDQFELHLDSIIKRYKGMTVTWILGSVAAVGFIFSVELQGFQINKLIASSLIFLFGVIGVFSICVLDIHVFHRFWGAFFVEEVKMEKRHPFLIDIGDVSVSLDSIRARIFGSGGFYTAIAAIMVFASGVTISFLTKNYWMKGGILFVTAFSILLLVKAMNACYRNLQKSIENLFVKHKKSSTFLS